jgi:hypothetical protein
MRKAREAFLKGVAASGRADRIRRRNRWRCAGYFVGTLILGLLAAGPGSSTAGGTKTFKLTGQEDCPSAIGTATLTDKNLKITAKGLKPKAA